MCNQDFTNVKKHRERNLTFSLSSVATLLIWVTLLLMMVSPPFKIPSLPDGIRIHDLTILLLIAVCVAIFSRGVQLRRLASPVFLSFIFYVAAILLLPLIGIAIIPQANFSMYFGDLRWLHVLILVFASLVVYRRAGIALLEKHLIVAIILAVSITWLVLLHQVYMQTTGVAAPKIIEIWYPEEQTGLRYGYHIYRFAGPFGAISALSIFGVVLCGAGLFTNERGVANSCIVVSGLIFALASGGRTGFVALLIIAIFLLLFLLFRQRRISIRSIVIFATTAAIAFLLVIVAANFNLGRLDSGRIGSIFAVAFGDETLYNIAGRGGQRWSEPLGLAQQWSKFGTLVNPSHALDLRAFDNYYIFLWAQAGPVILFLFYSTIFLSLFAAFKNYKKAASFQNSFALIVILVLPLFAYTQNTMTGLLARVLLGIALTIILLNQGNKRPSHKLPGGL